MLRFRSSNRLGPHLPNSLRKLDIFINYKCSHYFVIKIVSVESTNFPTFGILT